MPPAARRCTGCGECLNHCPVFRLTKQEECSPKAKQILLASLRDGGAQIPLKDILRLSRLCAGCGRCGLICPQGLCAATALAEARASSPGWAASLWDLWISRLGPVWLGCGHIAGNIPPSFIPKPLRPGHAFARSMAPSPEPSVWLRLEPTQKNKKQKQVVLFAGCTATNLRPGWHSKASALLRALGYNLLDSTGFRCCGGTLKTAGKPAVAEEMRQHNIRYWEQLGSPDIVTFCASCHQELSGYTGEHSVAWQTRLTHLSALLAEAQWAVTAEAPPVWGYHQPCHMPMPDYDKFFLERALPGLRQGTEPCCGMGGILQLTDPETAAGMGKACAESFPPDAAALLTGCGGCYMQLATHSRVPVWHYLDVIALPDIA